MKNFIKYFTSMIADFLFPPKCPKCKRYIENRNNVLCDKCLQELINQKIDSESINTIDNCEKRIIKKKIKHKTDWTNEEQYINNILAVEPFKETNPPIKEIWRITLYRKGLRAIILKLKYEKQLYFTRLTDKILDKAIETEPQLIKILQQIDFAIAVPLHEQREKERGFNQVEKIFNNWLNKNNVEIKRFLVRRKITAHLYELTPKERLAEVTNAFALSEGAQVEGKRILIIDDIYTTGTTMGECAKILKSAGAAEIYGLALASDFKND